MKKTTSLVQASFVLASSAMLVKVLSAIYRIPLTRMLGAYAMGKYSAVFNIFMPFFSLAAAGITTAVAKYTAQISEDELYKKIKDIKKSALFVYILFSVILTVAFIFAGVIYSKTFGEKTIFLGCVILAPNLIFASIENVFKGLSQGQMNMLPTAKANLIESVSKTMLGLLSVYFVVSNIQKNTSDYAIAAAFLSITISGFICWVYLAISYKGNGADNNSGDICGGYNIHNRCGNADVLYDIETGDFVIPPENQGFSRGNATEKSSNDTKKLKLKNRFIKPSDDKTTARQLLKISLPISMSALTVSLVNFFDTAVCLPILQNIPAEKLISAYKGASFKSAGDISMFLFGTYQGMVLTIFNMIPALLSCLGTAFLPIISKTQASKSLAALQRQSDKLFRITSAAGIPMCVFVLFFSSDIISMLFSTNLQQTVVPKTLLQILVPFAIIASYTFVFNAIMHAFERSDKVFKILVVASVIKCVLSYFLCGVADINIKGFAITTCIFYSVIFILTLIEILKSNIKFKPFKIFFIPLVASFAALFLTTILQQNILLYLPLFLRVIFCGVLFSLIYILIIIISGFISDI